MRTASRIRYVKSSPEAGRINSMKKRLDVLLVERGYAQSREKARAVIMSGSVYVNGQKEDKAGASFAEEGLKLEVRGNDLKYVSRGGLKLEKALKVWPISLEGCVCLDIGASTGELPTVCCKTERRRSIP